MTSLTLCCYHTLSYGRPLMHTLFNYKIDIYSLVSSVFVVGSTRQQRYGQCKDNTRIIICHANLSSKGLRQVLMEYLTVIFPPHYTFLVCITKRECFNLAPENDGCLGIASLRSWIFVMLSD